MSIADRKIFRQQQILRTDFADTSKTAFKASLKVFVGRIENFFLLVCYDKRLQRTKTPHVFSDKSNFTVILFG